LLRLGFCRRKVPMQNLKCILVCCAVTVGTAVLPVRATDAELQNKLQEALDKKLTELQTQPPAATPTAPVVPAKPAKAQAAPAVAPAPVAKSAHKAKKAAPAPVVQPVAAPVAQAPYPPAAASAAKADDTAVLAMPPASDPDAIAKAREALRQKMNQLEAVPVTTPAPTAKPSSGATAPAAAPVDIAQAAAPAASPTTPTLVMPAITQAAPAPAPEPAPVPARKAKAAPAAAPAKTVPAQTYLAAADSTLVGPTPVSPEDSDKARAALRQKMNELEVQKPGSVTRPTPGSAAASATAKPQPGAQPMSQPMASTPEAKPPQAKKPAKLAPVFTPIQGPAAAVSGDKQQRLTELLRKYKADEISPEEYHQQRAKIMGEP
jgi:hypothetical protein